MACECVLIVVGRSQVLKDTAALLPDGKVRSSARMAAITAGGVHCPHGHDALRVLIWQGRQQHSFHHGEDGGGRTDAQGQSENRGDGKARRFAKLMQRESHVRPDALKRRPLPDLAAAFCDRSYVAEFTTGFLRGLLWRQARFHQLLNSLVEMFLDRDGEIVVAAVA